MQNRKYLIPIAIIVVLFVLSFCGNAEAATFTWKHEDTRNTTEYVLYKQVGEQDPIENGQFVSERDDLPVGTTPAGGSLEMKNVRIEPGAIYYLRAENGQFVSGPSNSIQTLGIPAGITELNLTIAINVNTQ